MFNWRVRANSGIFTQSMWIVCAPLVLFISLKHRTSKTKTRKESGNEVKTLPIGWWWITQSPHVFPFWRVGFSIFTTFMYLSKCVESQFYVCANGCYGLGGCSNRLPFFPCHPIKEFEHRSKNQQSDPFMVQKLFISRTCRFYSVFSLKFIFHILKKQLFFIPSNLFAKYRTKTYLLRTKHNQIFARMVSAITCAYKHIYVYSIHKSDLIKFAI